MLIIEIFRQLNRIIKFQLSIWRLGRAKNWKLNHVEKHWRKVTLAIDSVSVSDSNWASSCLMLDWRNFLISLKLVTTPVYENIKRLFFQSIIFYAKRSHRLALQMLVTIMNHHKMVFFIRSLRMSVNWFRWSMCCPSCMGQGNMW